MIKPSVLELKDSLNILAGINKNDNINDFNALSKKCYKIGSLLERENKGLSEKWFNASEIFKSLGEKTSIEVDGITRRINAFVDSSYKSDLELEKAVEDANSVAEDIMNSLRTVTDSNTLLAAGYTLGENASYKITDHLQANDGDIYYVTRTNADGSMDALMYSPTNSNGLIMDHTSAPGPVPSSGN
jgi:hypothetical protein